MHLWSETKRSRIIDIFRKISNIYIYVSYQFVWTHSIKCICSKVLSDFGFKYLRISSVRFTKESLCAFSLPLLFSLCAETNTYTHERAHNANIHLSNVWITCNFVNNGENCENILNMWIFVHEYRELTIYVYLLNEEDQ